MAQFTGWENLYTELAEKVNNNINQIEWLDLWHNQVGFLVEEHPFPTPAVFFSFRMTSAENLGNKAQDANVQIDMYYFYETFLDTNDGAFNQESALDFLKVTTDLHKLFHGTTGVNYSEMTRVGFAPVDTGSAGNLYKISFSCKVIDETAVKQYDHVVPGDLTITEGENPTPNEPSNDFIIVP